MMKSVLAQGIGVCYYTVLRISMIKAVSQYEAYIEGVKRWQYLNNAWAVFAPINVAAPMTASTLRHAARARSAVR